MEKVLKKSIKQNLIKNLKCKGLKVYFKALMNNVLNCIDDCHLSKELNHMIFLSVSIKLQHKYMIAHVLEAIISMDRFNMHNM